MKPITITFAGREYHLLYNGAAMFKLQDIDSPFTAITKDFDAFCRIISVLSEQGELFRRYEGYDPGSFIDPEEFAVKVSPVDVTEYRIAAMDAVLAGMSREVEAESKERDISLEKFKKKPDSKTKSRKQAT